MDVRRTVATYWPAITLAAFALGAAHICNIVIPASEPNYKWWMLRDILYKLEVAYAFYIVRVYAQRFGGDKWLLVWLTVLAGLMCESAAQVWEGINQYHWMDLVIGTITLIIARRKYVDKAN